MEALKIVEYNGGRVLKAASKVAATLFSGLSILLCFVTWGDLNIYNFSGKFIIITRLSAKDTNAS